MSKTIEVTVSPTVETAIQSKGFTGEALRNDPDTSKLHSAFVPVNN